MNENNYMDAWQYAMNQLHEEYKSKGEENTFVTWFKLDYISDTIDTITVAVPSEFMEMKLNEKNIFNIVLNKIRQVTGQENLKFELTVKNVEFKMDDVHVQAEKQISKETQSQSENDSEKTARVKNPTLNEAYTFETFVPGENSNFAYQAAKAVAANPGNKFNPILFYGGSGLGKTHLMQAIGNYINDNADHKMKICYVSADNFLDDFINSLNTKTTDKFKSKYRNLDVLLLDDIHNLEGKEQTQEELFNTFNVLFGKKAQMVFTCDRSVRDIKEMDEHLVSRLSNGMVIDLQPPNFETRCAIIRKKLDSLGVTLDKDVIDYIGKVIETNVRDLEQAITKVTGYEDLTGIKVDLPKAKDLLRDATSDNMGNVTVEIILKVIAENYDVSVLDIKGKKRDNRTAMARMMAAYLIFNLMDYSLVDTGRELGGKNHATVIHAKKTIEDLRKTDPDMEEKIKSLKSQIKNYKKK